MIFGSSFSVAGICKSDEFNPSGMLGSIPVEFKDDPGRKALIDTSWAFLVTDEIFTSSTIMMAGIGVG